MFDINKLIIRKATLADVNFIATTIIEAEKSSTDKNGTANYFELSEEEYKDYLIQMLEEEIDGCEISLSSFLIAEYDSENIAAFGGWVEDDLEDGTPSGLIKSNLITFTFPKDKVIKSSSKSSHIQDIQIKRKDGTYQLEYSYTKPEFRGLDIVGRLIDEHTKIALSYGIKTIQVHVFDNNTNAKLAYQKRGFTTVQKFQSNDKMVFDYYPSNVLLLMEKTL